jgi:hypothetical protein
MTTFEAFRCGACGGQVTLVAKAGRRRFLKPGFLVEIPADYAIPTCAKCGETYLDPDQAESLDRRLEEVHGDVSRSHWAARVETLKKRHSTSQRTIATVLGITPSHLSHVLAGTTEPSVPLTRLVDALEACPAEFLRHLKRSEGLVAALRPTPKFSGFIEITIPNTDESNQEKSARADAAAVRRLEAIG